MSSDLVLSQAAVIAKGWADHQEQPVDQTAPEADRRNVSDEIISVSDREVDHDSTNGGGGSQASCSSISSEEESSESEPAMSEVSVQHSMLEHAYQSIKDAFNADSSYTCFFFAPLPLLLASGTMGIEMAIAPLWVKGIWE